MSNGRRVDTAVVERFTERVDVVGVDTGEVGVERALERGRVDTVDAVHLLAPLHGTAVDVPEPPAGVGQRLGVAQAGLGLGQRRLRQALLGQVACDADDAAARPGRRRRPDGATPRSGCACRHAWRPRSRRGRPGRRRRPCRAARRRRRGRAPGKRSRIGVPTTSSAWRPKMRSALRFHATMRPSASWLISASADTSTNASSTASRIGSPASSLVLLAHGPLLSGRRIPSRPGVREPRGRTVSHTDKNAATATAAPQRSTRTSARTSRQPPSTSPGGSPPGRRCGASPRTGRSTPATSPSSSSTR